MNMVMSLKNTYTINQTPPYFGGATSIEVILWGLVTLTLLGASAHMNVLRVLKATKATKAILVHKVHKV